MRVKAVVIAILFLYGLVYVFAESSVIDGHAVLCPSYMSVQ
jgi:hypothetical protein